MLLKLPLAGDLVDPVHLHIQLDLLAQFLDLDAVALQVLHHPGERLRHQVGDRPANREGRLTAAQVEDLVLLRLVGPDAALALLLLNEAEKGDGPAERDRLLLEDDPILFRRRPAGLDRGLAGFRQQPADLVLVLGREFADALHKALAGQDAVLEGSVTVRLRENGNAIT